MLKNRGDFLNPKNACTSLSNTVNEWYSIWIKPHNSLVSSRTLCVCTFQSQWTLSLGTPVLPHSDFWLIRFMFVFSLADSICKASLMYLSILYLIPPEIILVVYFGSCVGCFSQWCLDWAFEVLLLCTSHMCSLCLLCRVQPVVPMYWVS